MARKKRKGEKKEEEEYEFVPPEFDEESFLRKDMKSTWALVVTVICGVAFAVLGYLIGEATEMMVGFIALVVGMVLLRYIWRLTKIDLDNIEKKSLAGNYLLFFFLFLGIFILIMNPPFSDHTDPKVTDLEVWVDSSATGEWTKLTRDNQETLVNTGDPVNITANITDNGELDSAKIKVFPSGESGTFVNMTHVEDNVYQYNNSYGTADTHYYIIQAEDEAGNIEEHEGSFLVNG
ncbi:MAG: hypothetical protein ACLFPN_01595 [Methanomassiliicoccales archaeon]